MEAPAAMAKTNKAFCGAAQSTPTKGAVKPAAVIMATVAEPCNRRITTAAKKANNNKGIPWLAMASAIILPAAVVMSICLKVPPAPVNKIIIPAGAIERLAICCNAFDDTPWRRPNRNHATKLAKSNAPKG